MSHHHDRRGIVMPTESAPKYAQGNMAWDSTNENQDRTATLGRQPRSMAFDLNKPDNSEQHTIIELSNGDYTVAWVCALPSEMAAAKAMLEVVHKPLSMNPNDTNQYVFGSIDHHNIVIVCLSPEQYGTTRAAILANKMRWNFPSICIQLAVGIGGGVPSKGDMRLGDVVVSSGTVYFPHVTKGDFGTIENTRQFHKGGPREELPENILRAVAKLRADHEGQSSSIPLIHSEMIRRNPTMSAYTYPGVEQDRLYAATYEHVGETCESCDPAELVYRNARPDNNPRIHHGTIASANDTMKHGLTRDLLASTRYGDIYCFEKDANGFMDHFPCLVIRGIGDYSDSHKTKQWQEYAASTAAAYARELLSVIPPVQSAQESPSIPRTPGQKFFNSNGQRATPQMMRRGGLMSSLKPRQSDSRNERIKEAHPQTCHWLLGHSDYLCWLDPSRMADHHGLLWISGKPGTGKSTIMKYAWSRATGNATPESAVISFFLDARDYDPKQTIEKMYKSLLLQLLESYPMLQVVLDDPAVEFYTPSDPGLSKVPLLQGLLLKAVAKLHRQEVTCFVDTLDECDEKDVGDMLEFFVDLGNCAVQNDTKFYTCFSSRPHHMDVPYCQKFTLEHQTGHLEDLGFYVQDKLRTGNKKQSEDIKAQVVQKASGVFLWAALVVDILNKEYIRGDISAVVESLGQIPLGLSELFHHILTRDNDNIDDVLLCIQWLFFGSRPLKREEYYFAMVADIQSHVPGPHDTDEITTEDMDLFVLTTSRGLAEAITGDQFLPWSFWKWDQPYRSKKPIVEFVHESVRGFLLKDGGLRSLWPDLESDFAGKSHDRLKKCCYTYLQADISDYLDTKKYSSKEAVEQIQEEAGDKFPFMEYAVNQVLYHAEAAASSISQADFLQDFSELDPGSWRLRRRLCDSMLTLKLFGPRNACTPPDSAPKSFFHSLMKQEYTSLITTTIGSPSLFTNLIIGPLATWDNVLSRALKTKKAAAARAILHSLKVYQDRQRGGISTNDPGIARGIGLMINKPDRGRSQGRPFSYAAEQGLLDVAELLLEFGAAGGEFDPRILLSWISRACKNGHGDIVKLLFTWDPSTLPSRDCPELQPSHYPHSERPVFSNHLKRSAAFIALGSAMTLSDMQSDPTFITEAFWKAIRQKQDDIAIFLFKKGAKTHPVPSRTGPEPVLHAAIHSGLEYLSGLLLEASDDIKALDSNGRTALHIASGSSALPRPSAAARIARALISKGTDVHTCDNDGKTPLHLACGDPTWPGSPAVAETLIGSGADVNALDKDRSSPLHAACEAGNQAAVELLVEKGADINALDRNENSPLHVACKAGNHAAVKVLVRNGAEIPAPNSDGASALHLAVQAGNQELVEIFLDKGVDPDAPDKRGQSPLHLACLLPDHGIAEIVIEKSTDLDRLNEDGRSALHHACQFENLETARMLLERGAAVGIPDKHGKSPLHLACQSDKPGPSSSEYGYNTPERIRYGMQPDEMAVARDVPEMVDLLFKHGAVLDCKDNVGETPLFSAMRRSRGPIFNLLLKLGADVCTTDACGRTVLFALPTMGRESYLDDKGAPLLRKGLDPTRRDNQGQTFLHVACQSASVGPPYLDFVREVIRSGLDVDAQDDSGRTPLMNAAASGNGDFVLFLLSLGVDGDKVDSEGRTPLTEAFRVLGTRYNLRDTIFLPLLEYGVKPYASAGTDNNILFAAVENKSALVVGPLLDHVDVGITDAVGRSCMFLLPQTLVYSGKTWAEHFGSISMVDCLMRKGADINHRDSTGQSALHHVAQGTWDAWNGNPSDFYRNLSRHGVEVDAQDQTGKTPLFCAVSCGNSTEMACLLQIGADPNLVDARGQTPLCERIAGRMSDVLPDVRLLLEHGAAAGAVGMDGETPLDLATRLGNRELIELLQSHLGPTNSLLGEHVD